MLRCGRRSGEEGRADQLHEAGEHDQVGLVRRDASASARVPVLAVVVVARAGDEGGDAGALGAGQALDAVAIGADGDHWAPYAGSVQASISACRLVPDTGDEDDEAGRSRGAV